MDADGSGQESIRIYNNTTLSEFPSLYLDSSNNPHIAWHDYEDGDHDIFYLKWVAIGEPYTSHGWSSSPCFIATAVFGGYTDGHGFLSQRDPFGTDSHSIPSLSASYGARHHLVQGGAGRSQITTLCKFRDERLLTNPLGQAFVRFYYRHSPKVAGFIRDKEPLRAMVRIGLKPIVWIAGKVTQ